MQSLDKASISQNANKASHVYLAMFSVVVFMKNAHINDVQAM